jgi:hypothetical protein
MADELTRAAMGKPANIAQTEIPVGNAVGRKHDPNEAYEAMYGPKKAAGQRAAYTEARHCTCKSEHKDKWGTRWQHKAPCVRAGKRF